MPPRPSRAGEPSTSSRPAGTSVWVSSAHHVASRGPLETENPESLQAWCAQSIGRALSHPSSGRQSVRALLITGRGAAALVEIVIVLAQNVLAVEVCSTIHTQSSPATDSAQNACRPSRIERSGGSSISKVPDTQRQASRLPLFQHPQAFVESVVFRLHSLQDIDCILQKHGFRLRQHQRAVGQQHHNRNQSQHVVYRSREQSQNTQYSLGETSTAQTRVVIVSKRTTRSLAKKIASSDLRKFACEPKRCAIRYYRFPSSQQARASETFSRFTSQRLTGTEWALPRRTPYIFCSAMHAA